VPVSEPATAELFDQSSIDLDAANAELERKTAEERVAYSLELLKPNIVLSSSFGAQAAVLLHMCARQWAEVPVVLVDTGYLFPETYNFIDELTDRLSLNLKVYRPETCAAWQEARYCKLWEQGLEGINEYNRMNKIEPMKRALRELRAQGWIAGLRRDQASTRRDLNVLGLQDGRLKVLPIIDWRDLDVFNYLTEHDLPYHPLWIEGYTSIGDIHTSHKLTDGMTEDETRFFGLKRECGLHESDDED
jgi:phosphoadenosine phosphosulfate reductase